MIAKDFRRFWSKVLIGDGCWEWQAYRTPLGYGRYGVRQDGERKIRGAHRVAYEMIIGRIPEGLDLDHLCRNPPCVRPDHLEAVTTQVNLIRGDTFNAHNAAKTHCPQGHEYTPENTYRWRAGRRCRRCHTDQEMAAYRRRRA